MHDLKLYKEEIASGAVVRTRDTGAICARYVVSGSIRVRGDALVGTLSANSAWLQTQPAELCGGSLPAVALRWELAASGASESVIASDGVTSSLLLGAQLDLERSRDYLVRCDRVDFPPGGVALLHTHQGGGIRCLIQGSIEIETKGARHTYGPLQAWFEAGPDPVFAATSEREPSAFARVMILPLTLLGKSSISYVKPEDLAKPKNQKYQVFIDTPIELPA